MNEKVQSVDAKAVHSSLRYEEVRRQIQSLLPASADFDDEQNLIEMGLDSLQMMRIVSSWRRLGSSVTFAELIASPRLYDWWKLLERDAITASTEQGEAVLQETKVHLPANEPFLLTDVQHAYWIGRRDDQPLGGVSCHAYLELDGIGVTAGRLQRAWQQVQQHHGSLRTRYLSDGRQELMAEPYAEVLEVYDLQSCPAEEMERELSAIRKRLSHRLLDVEKGQVSGLSLSLLPEGHTRIHMDVDLLAADVQSLHILLRDLAAVYARGSKPTAPENWSFAAYLKREAERRATEKERAAAYWQQRISTLPAAPGLPLQVRPESVKQPYFSRRTFMVEPGRWKLLQQRAARNGVTPAMVLLSAYAEVLDRWSTSSKFLINIPLFDRQSDEPGIEEAVADFTNLLLLAVDCEAPQSFVQRVKDIQACFHEDVAHAAYSGVQLQRDLSHQRPGERDFAPVVFACNLGTPLLSDECRNTLGELAYMISQTPQVWLDFQIYELDGGLLLAWDAVDELFPEGLINDMFTALTLLIDRLTGPSNDWHASVNEVWKLEQADEACIAETVDHTDCFAGQVNGVHAPFFRAAAARPEHPALIDSGSRVMRSYGEVSGHALRIAAFLREQGVQTGDAVAVTLPRGADQIAAVLGVLAAGASYVPIGIQQPPARRKAIHRKAGVRFILASPQEEHSASGWEGVPGVLDIADAAAAAPLAEPLEADVQQPAYIIFTSGSTGEPKGVEISHAGAWNTLADINRRYSVSPSDKMLAVSALDFDLSVYDIFGLLGAGGTLVLVPEGKSRDADYWLEQCLLYEATLWNSVPVLLDMLLVAAESAGRLLPSLRLTLLSGDWIGLDLPQRLRQSAVNSRLIAMGGATEASIWSNYFEVNLPLPKHWTSIPYGYALSNQFYRIVDSKGRDCPDWVTGELWIGGAGVALGYRGDPELTAERFVMWNDSRWYRTGDLGRYWPEDIIEFLGRKDFQVKIRGHRIELGEIETALKEHPGVRDAVVTATEQQGTKRLTGYVVPETGGESMLMESQAVDAERAGALWAAVSEAVQGQAHRSFTSEDNTGDFLLFREQMERLSAQHMLLALQRTGVFIRPDEAYTLETLLQKGRIVPRYHVMMERWLIELEASSCLRRLESGKVTLAQPVVAAVEPDQAERLEHLKGNREGHAADSPVGGFLPYLLEVSRSSTELLQGNADPLHLFFAEDNNLSPDRLMQLMPGAGMRLDLAQKLLETIMRQRAGQGPVCILELGARSSSFTQSMLSCLESWNGDEAEYTITDPSTYFLQTAESKLGSRGTCLQYKLLDIEQPVLEQGYTAHSYDIVLASDSLHRVRNIESALANVRSLLAPGGILLALEMTYNSRLQQITTAFLEDGFTRYTDERLITQQPLLGADKWRDLLLENQYAAAALFPGPEEQESDYGMHVIAAQVPSCIRRFNPEQLVGYLSSRLPQYMVPADLIPLERLPLTSNGKVNRLALPALAEWQAVNPKEADGLPRTPVENELRDIWCSILKKKEIGMNENFFTLGGDSLLAMKLIAEVRERLKVQVPLGSLFEAPTIAGLAEQTETMLLRGEQQATAVAMLPQIVSASGQEQGPFPLTDIQQAYWLGREGVFALGDVSTHCYFEIEGHDLDMGRIEQAWQRLIRQHGMMRAVVLPDGQHQQILQEPPAYRIQAADWSELNPEASEARLMAVREEMSHQVLAADRWPLYEVRASLLPANRVRLHISFDNLLFDGWSMFHLLSEWGRLYRNPEAILPELELTFRDYVLALEQLKSSEQYEQDMQFWLGRLDTLPPAPELQLARSPESIAQQRFNRLDARLNSETWVKLRKRAAVAGLSPSGLLLAAYAEALAAWSRRPAFTINLTQFNRLPLHPQVDNLVGDFTSLTLLAVNQASGRTFIDRARNLQQQLWADMDHPLVGGVQVQRELAKRSGSHAGGSMPIVFTSALGVDNWNEDGSGEQWLGRLVYNITQTPQVWLDHQVVEQDGQLLLIWDAVEGLFPEGMLEDMFEAYSELLHQLAADEGVWQAVRPSLIEVPRLGPRRQANETEMPISPDTLDQLFTRQAVLRPGQPAIISANRTLTYGELNHLSNEVALLLRDRNVLPNMLVGIVMEKGWEQAVAALGILKAGAAYLPLDPSYPQSRLRELLADGRVAVVLTQSRMDEGLAWLEDVDRLIVDEIAPGWQEHEEYTVLESSAKPEHLAYVIYTSGSTGKPKGVMTDHRGAVNTVLDINRRFEVGPEDRVLALSNMNFDLSVYDMFGMLAAGGAVVIPESDSIRDPACWLAWMERAQVTLWNTVPAFMQMLLEHVGGQSAASPTALMGGQALPQALRLVLLSGDWIPLDLPDRIREHYSRAKVVGLGGATESSIWSNLLTIDNVDPDWKSIPYGYPMTNQRYYVLNELMEDCPVWVPGGLYIGGIGLAQGYWRDEEKTYERFIYHPRTGERMYHTGDTGRYLPDGSLEFLGREDFQVKIRGHRIELGEIETTIKQIAGVKEAIVLVTSEGGSGSEKQLIGFVVPHEHEQSELFEVKLVDADTLRQCRQELAAEEQMQFRKLLSAIDAEETAAFLQELDNVGISAIRAAFTGFGLFKHEGERYSQYELMQLMQVQPRYETLLAHWLKALAEEGWLRQETNAVYTSLQPFTGQQTHGQFSAAMKHATELRQKIQQLQDLFRHSQTSIAGLLQGSIEPLELFLAKDAFLTPDALRPFNIAGPFYHELLRSMFGTIVQVWPLDRPLCVLEIGTRSGGFADGLVPLLSAGRGHYRYADESDFFTERAREGHMHADALEYGRLDMNEKPLSQGYRPHVYDVIVADNTLHRARNVEVTLEYLQQLLAPGGLLIFTEATRNSRLLLTTAGFFEDGFSRFADERKESKLPLLTGERWQELLQSAGYTVIGGCPEGLHAAEVFGQQLFVAQAPGTAVYFEPQRLAEALRRQLPNYMVPTAYVLLDELPLSANGKVDRKALAVHAQAAERPEVHPGATPVTELQQQIATVWEEVLGCREPGLDDSFFEQGGDSLRAIQCVNILKERFAIEVTLQQWFEAPTIGSLADLLEVQLYAEDDEDEYEEGFI